MNFTASRLINQKLSGERLRSPQDVVSWLVAVQAQEYRPAKWAVGMRVEAGSDAAVEKALTEGAILRTHIMRPTWHFVTPSDIYWLLSLTAPRVHQINGTMYRKLELSGQVLNRSCTLIASALEGGNHLTRAELGQLVANAGIGPGTGLHLAYIVMFAELEGVICSGVRRGNQSTYALLAERAPVRRALTREEAVSELTWRYFSSRGPATVHDFAKWSGLTVTDGKHGTEIINSRLRSEYFEGKQFWYVSEAADLIPGPPMIHLLSLYDEYISGYKDHSPVIDPVNAQRLRAGDEVAGFLLVIDGVVSGVWKRREKNRVLEVEFTLYRELTEGERQAVASEVERFGDFVGLPVDGNFTI